MLIYKDAHKNTHKLVSHGRVNLDRDTLKATIESPKKEGATALDKQIYYEEAEIAFYADNASIEYSIVEDVMQPESLTQFERKHPPFFPRSAQTPALWLCRPPHLFADNPHADPFCRPGQKSSLLG